MRYHNAQVEWNEMKSNEEYVKEKIEEYLEMFNRPDESETGDKNPSTAKRVKKRMKVNDDSSTTNKDAAGEDENKTNKSSTENPEDLNNQTADEGEKTADDDSDGEFIPKSKTKIRLTVSGKPRKPPRRERKITDEELMKHPLITSELEASLLDSLEKDKRQPAQERAVKELSSINERIASLVQVRQMGLSTPENKKQLKQLFKDKRAKITELKRLQTKQRSSHKYRDLKKKIVRMKEIFSVINHFF